MNITNSPSKKDFDTINATTYETIKSINLTNAPFQNNTISELLNVLPELWLNQTALLSASVQSSGPQTWKLSFFFKIAFPLLGVTILLPLVGGFITRFVVKNVAKVSGRWRAIFIIPGLIYIIGVYWAIPHYIPGRLNTVILLVFTCALPTFYAMTRWYF